MNKQGDFSWKLFNKAPVVGILRGQPLDLILWIANVYEKAGLSTLEVTMNTPGATKIIAALRNQFPNLNIGAGTVCAPKDLDLALSAGAQFIVTPILDLKVIQTCAENNIPVFPGAFTPTEIYQAWSAGADAVKVFPATQLGTRYIKDIIGPLNKIKLLPTGGVTAENLASFLKAGAIGAGMGSALLKPELIHARDAVGLEKHFRFIKQSTQF